MTGFVLLFAGAAGYGVFCYGLRIAYRPEQEPDWLGQSITASLAIAALGLLLLLAGLLVWLQRRR